MQTIPWNLASLVKTHHGIIPHRETNGIAEGAVRRIEGGTSAVLLQSGLDEKLVEVVGRDGFYGM